jgi:rfaE bifunctional protein nucleotidyltransferase chain/domain
LRGTTVAKTRVRAGGQSIVRFDSGDGTADHRELPSGVAEAINSAGAILVADYGLGVSGHPEIRRLLERVAPDVPIVWDPHPRGSVPTAGVTLVTPNDAEAARFTTESDSTDDGMRAAHLARAWRAAHVVITRGSRSAQLHSTDSDTTVAVDVPRVAAPGSHDTCGAGDCFATAAAEGLRRGMPIDDCIRFATGRATDYVHTGGVASIARPPRTVASVDRDAVEFAARVRRRGGRVVATGGCFDLLHPGHVSLLRYARQLGDALVVCLNSDDSVRRAKGEGRPVVSHTDRAHILLELESVDAVAIFDEATPTAILDRLRPAVWVKGSDYTEQDLPEAATVRQHGGEVHFAPVLPGYSTTRLVAAARSIA